MSEQVSASHPATKSSGLGNEHHCCVEKEFNSRFGKQQTCIKTPTASSYLHHNTFCEMKLFVLSTLLAAAGQASAFAPGSSNFRATRLMANVLEGKEIEKDFTPIQNMLLVKTVAVLDQTEGGLFLTGKVSCSGTETFSFLLFSFK